MYIEVKTTTGPENGSIYITANEMEMSEMHPSTKQYFNFGDDGYCGGMGGGNNLFTILLLFCLFGGGFGGFSMDDIFSQFGDIFGGHFGGGFGGFRGGNFNSCKNRNRRS